MGSVETEFIPIIIIVPDEVCNLMEGLVCDNVFQWHGILMWMNWGVIYVELCVGGD